MKICIPLLIIKGMDGLTDIEGVYLDFNNSTTKNQ